jgi:hypothetical protein
MKCKIKKIQDDPYVNLENLLMAFTGKKGLIEEKISLGNIQHHFNDLC